MDARVYSHLVDSIAGAADASELSAVRELITATEMHQLEREALEHNISIREELLRTADAEVARPSPARGD
jgi:hypothetical protein